MQSRPWPLAIVSLAVMIALLVPGVRAAAGQQRRRQRPGQHQLAPGFRPPGPRASARGSTGRCCSSPSCRPGADARRYAAVRAAARATPGVAAVTQPRIAPSGAVAVMPGLSRARRRRREPRPTWSTSLRHQVLPPLERRTGVPVLVGGFTAGSIDFSQRAVEQAAAVHRDRRPALGAAAAGHLPLAGDPDPGGDDEPAQHRRRARRDGRRVPVGVARQACSGCRRAPSSPGYRCSCSRSCSGCPWTTRCSWSRAYASSGCAGGRVRRGRRRHRVHRTRDQRGRGDHGLRVPVVHAR